MRRAYRQAILCLFVATAAQSQPFPSPGTGVYTWNHVGNVAPEISTFAFGEDGGLVGYGGVNDIFQYEPPTPATPLGRWITRGRWNGIQTLYPLGADTLVAGRSNGAAIGRSLDGGATWTEVARAPDLFTVGPRDPAGFAIVPPGTPHAGRILAGGRFYHSDDRGATWQPGDITALPVDQAGIRDGFIGVFAVLPSGRILFGGDGGIGYTDDGGDSYSVTPIWQFYRYTVYGLAAAATPGSRQAAEAGGGAAACGLADTSLCDGAVAVGRGATSTELNAAWWTNDGGRSWSAPVALPQPRDGLYFAYSAGVVSVGVGPDGLGRAVTVMGRGVVYVTSDGGQSWQLVGRMPLGQESELGAHFVSQLVLGPDGHLWVATRKAGSLNGWMYRSAEPADAAFAVAGEAPPEALERVGVSVRPNPAGGRVSVVLRAAEAGTARVIVVDARGREVAVVLDGAVSAGETALSVETGAWPTGVYVVRAAVGSQTAAARLVVAR